MPIINFPDIEENDYSPLPVGEYMCVLDEVEEDTCKKGEMWNLTLKVNHPEEYYGRKIFDKIFFSEKALSRVKLICSGLGLDTSKEFDLTPSDLRERKCLVTVGIEDYVTKEGEKKKRNYVPFAGYKKCEEQRVESFKEECSENAVF